MSIKPTQWIALGSVLFVSVAIAIVAANNYMAKKQAGNG